MHVLVTGGAGFIGSHLVRSLLEAGHRVQVIDNLSTGSQENIALFQDHENFLFVEADGTTLPSFEEKLQGVDVLVHLAAAVGVQKVIDEPVQTLETNVDFTRKVLAACASQKCRVLIASTSEVYGRSSHELFQEGDDLLIGPPTSRRWGYAASKLIDEFLAMAYYYEGKLPVTVLRLFNTVGPGQTGRYGMVIPRFVRQALLGEDITIYGSGQQRRTFTDVFQVVQAIIELMNCPQALGKIVNVGGSAEVSIDQLADKILELTQSSSSKVYVPYLEAYGEDFEDMQRRNPCTQKLQELLGWAPQGSIESILKPIIQDMKEKLAEGKV